MDANTKDREPTEGAPREGTLLELSADPPETELDIASPGPGEVMVQVSGPAYDLAEDAQVHEGTEAPPSFAFELLLLAAPAHRLDLNRTTVARSLLQGPLWPAVRQERFAILMGEGYEPDDVTAAGERVLPRVLFLWGQSRGRARWRTFLPWLRNKLNDAVPREEELLGPDARKKWRSDEGGAPDSLEDIRPSREDEGDAGVLMDTRLLDHLHDEVKSNQLRVDLELLRSELGEDARRLLVVMENVTGPNVSGAAKRLGWTRYRARKAWGEIRKAASDL